MRHARPPEAATADLARLHADRAAAAIPAVFAAVLGFFILYGVGFAHMPALHNAAHDARHAFGFPCH